MPIPVATPAALPLAGGCACRAVRYSIGVAPIIVHCCHCSRCQLQTGTAFVLNAIVETEAVAIAGQAPVRHDVPTDSGRPHGIYHCAGCGVAVWSEYAGMTALRFVRVGTLDEPAALAPDVHIFTRSKLPWLMLPAGKPAFEAYYEPKLDLPADSLERWRTAVRAGIPAR